jgi:hypothetical protein
VDSSNGADTGGETGLFPKDLGAFPSHGYSRMPSFEQVSQGVVRSQMTFQIPLQRGRQHDQPLLRSLALDFYHSSTEVQICDFQIDEFRQAQSATIGEGEEEMMLHAGCRFDDCFGFSDCQDARNFLRPLLVGNACDRVWPFQNVDAKKFQGVVVEVYRCRRKS